MDRIEHLVQGNLQLKRGSLLRIEDGREMLVYVREGKVWITQEGDSRDRMLSSGERQRITRSGRTVATAMRSSTIALASPYEEGFANSVELVSAGDAERTTLYRSRRGAFSALSTRVAKAWVSMFAPAPKRLPAV